MKLRIRTRILLIFLFSKCVTSKESAVVFPVSNGTGPSLPVFPDDPVAGYVERPLAPKSDPFGRPLCTNSPKDTFCENVQGYPGRNLIRNAVHLSSAEFAELFGGTGGGITHRQKSGGSEGDEGERVCPQQSRLFYPKAAVNEEEKWAFVVNDIDYVQTVVAEICQEPDEPCRFLDGRLPSGLSSRCRQRYSYKRLLALHPDKKKAYTDAFRFPSCCVCYVKKPYLYKTRNFAAMAEDGLFRSDGVKEDAVNKRHLEGDVTEASRSNNVSARNKTRVEGVVTEASRSRNVSSRNKTRAEGVVTEAPRSRNVSSRNKFRAEDNVTESSRSRNVSSRNKFRAEGVVTEATWSRDASFRENIPIEDSVTESSRSRSVSFRN